MKILLKNYIQFKFHTTGVIFTMVTMFPHFPPKCGACVRPDTPVADGWAEAKMRVFTLSNLITVTDGPMDGPTNGPTDRQSLLCSCVSATRNGDVGGGDYEKKIKKRYMRIYL